MEKLEKQVNEAELEHRLGGWFTKRTILGVIGACCLAWLLLRSRFSSPPAPATARAEKSNTFIMPSSPNKRETPAPGAVNPAYVSPLPPSVVLPPAYGVTGQPGAVPEAAKVDPEEQERMAHRQREKESAFASMMVPASTVKTEERKEPDRSVAPPAPSVSSAEASAPPALYTIPQGTVASLALDSRIEGEMSGPVDAHFTEDFYLPGTRTLVIKQGARVLGKAQQVGNPQQRRIALEFTRIQRDPVARSCDINLESPALDEAGSVGVTGKLNTHLGSKIALGTLAAVVQAGSGSYLYSSGSYGPQQLVIGQTANGASQTATQLLAQSNNRLPVIRVLEGGRMTLPFLSDVSVRECQEGN